MTTQSDLQIINVALTIIVSNKINKCLLYTQSVFSNSHSVVFVVCSVKRKYNVTISSGKEHLVVDDDDDDDDDVWIFVIMLTNSMNTVCHFIKFYSSPWQISVSAAVNSQLKESIKYSFICYCSSRRRQSK